MKGKKISVKLKWGQRYDGFLINFDNYFNLLLENVSEWSHGNIKGEFGEILLPPRILGCNCRGAKYPGVSILTNYNPGWP